MSGLGEDAKASSTQSDGLPAPEADPSEGAGPQQGVSAPNRSGAGAPDASELLVDEPAGDTEEVSPEEVSLEELNVEALVLDLERVSAERDDYLDGLRRLQAEFENYRKAVAKRETDSRERANDRIVVELLSVLDACDGATMNGSQDVAPIRTSLLEVLTKQGLERLEPDGHAFDPELHDAVMHEPSDEVSAPTVAEVLRVGYRWKGRVLRPAMVKTVG